MSMELLTALSLFLFLISIAILIARREREKRGRSCYLLHYECYDPPEEMKLTAELAGDIAFRNERLGVEEYRFLVKTMSNSAIGDETFVPRLVVEGREERPSLGDALEDVEGAMFGTLDRLFEGSGVGPSEIDVLVVTVSLLSPSPSLSSRVVNRYKMRDDVRAYNVTGMGCSASIIGVNIVEQLFKVHKKMKAIVVSTEAMGSHWYVGKERSFMLSNCLFRTGGCSMLFTNDPSLEHRALIKLSRLLRTHIGSDDEAYKCCYQTEDAEGLEGFSLTRHLPTAAAQACRENLRALAPRILPLWEIVRYSVFSLLTYCPGSRVQPRLNLKAGVEHFCIHPGGRAIIDGTGKRLGLGEYDLEPSRMALHKWGNTSSAGFWYVLGYMEAKGRLKRGDRILMMSFGAGFKCNNCLWEVVRDLKGRNVWDHCIDEYPKKSLVNGFMDKYGWVFDERLNFVRLH